MEQVAGQRLDEWLTERPRTWGEVLDVFRDAARGLAAAHAQGLVHRDFKPENVVVARDGRARITNFGLAQARPRPSQVTAAVGGPAAKGELVKSSSAGTPAYMAPEQFRGRPADARSDQFSFCVALYRALYGQQPFDPDWAVSQVHEAGRRTPLGSVHFSLLVKSLDRTTLINFAKEVIGGNLRPPPAGTTVPSWLEGVVWRGLRTDPEDRYLSMDGLLADIAQGLGDSSVQAQSLFSRRGSLRKVAVVAGGAGVLALLGLGFLAWSRARR
jgi:serine/threonine protein kinase